MEKINEEITNIKLGFQNLNCDDFKKSLKMSIIEKYLLEVTKNPTETKKSICNRLNIAPAVLNRSFRECGLEKLIRKKKSVKDDNNKIKEIKENKKENKTRGGGQLNENDRSTREIINDTLKNY